MGVIAVVSLFPFTAMANGGSMRAVHPGYPWPVLLALAFLTAGLLAPPRFAWPTLKQVGLNFALFVGALLLRSGLGVWAPIHVNSQGPFWVRGAKFLEFPTSYGPGYPQFFHPFTDLWPQRPDLPLFAANVLLSSLIPLLVLGLARSLGLNRWKSLAMAFVALFAPLFIRFSASEGYFSLILLLALASPLAWMQSLTPSKPRCLPWRALFSLCRAFEPIPWHGRPSSWPCPWCPPTHRGKDGGTELWAFSLWES